MGLLVFLVAILGIENWIGVVTLPSYPRHVLPVTSFSYRIQEIQELIPCDDDPGLMRVATDDCLTGACADITSCSSDCSERT
ncbi:hypothetical protein BDZ89DRAFT_1057654 [Hymenopellis radicata]|nr:hypothetical protein BDZ89DRAFT_1057654 [Hymenopellis radicata]